MPVHKHANRVLERQWTAHSARLQTMVLDEELGSMP